MVSYQKWTQIAFDEAKSQGLEPSQESSAELVSVAAAIWNDRKDELNTANVSQARAIASQEINVA